MKKIIISILLFVVVLSGHAQSKVYYSPMGSLPSKEVAKMMNYLTLAEKAEGFNLDLYIRELSDQLALLALGTTLTPEIMEQGEAACRLWGHPLLLNNFATLLYKSGYIGTALSFYGAAWLQDNKNPQLATSIARCHLDMNDTLSRELAIKFCDKAIALDPDYGDALQLKATLCFMEDTEQERLKGIEYMIKSANTVWNEISIRQFNNVARLLEDLCEIYKERLSKAEKDIKEAKIFYPLSDKCVDMLIKVLSVGYEDDYKLKKDLTFTFFVPLGDLDYEKEGMTALQPVFGGWDLIQELRFGAFENRYAKQGLEIEKSLKNVSPSDREFLPKYSSIMGGKMLVDDSRQFYASLLLFWHFHTKLRVAQREAQLYYYPLYEKANKQAQIENGITHDEYDKRSYRLKSEKELWELAKVTGDALAATELKRANAHTVAYKDGYERYVQKVLVEYYRAMDKAVTFIQDDDARKYIGGLSDMDIVKAYQLEPLGLFSSLCFDVNASGTLSRTADAVLTAYKEEARQEYWRDFYEWRRDPTKDRLVTKRPAPRVTGVVGVNAKLGDLSVTLAVDGNSNIILSYDTPQSAYKSAYNLMTGVKTTATVTKVDAGWVSHGLSSANEALWASAEVGVLTKYGTSANTIKTYGSFAPSASITRGQGTQVTVDSRGNVIESAKINYTRRVVTGGTINTLHGDVSGQVVHEKYTLSKGYASKAVIISERATAGLSISKLGVAVGVEAGGIQSR